MVTTEQHPIEIVGGGVFFWVLHYQLRGAGGYEAAGHHQVSVTAGGEFIDLVGNCVGSAEPVGEAQASLPECAPGSDNR